MSSEKRHRIEWWTGAIVFVVFIGAHLVFGARAAVKVAGAACLVTGLYWMLRRSVPVGVEGRAPSLYLGGWAAVLAGLVIMAFGIALLVHSVVAVCLLGWGSDGEC